MAKYHFLCEKISFNNLCELTLYEASLVVGFILYVCYRENGH